MTTKSAAAPGRAGGYTLIELLTVLAIAGVLLSTGVPALGGWLLDGRRTAVANDLLATFLLARREGATLGRSVVVCGVLDGNRNGTIDPGEQRCSGADWSDGWMIATWSDANGNSVIDASELKPVRIFTTGAAGRLTVRAGNFSSSPPIRPRAAVVMKGAGMHTSNGTITVCDRRGAPGARAVILSWTGRARVSSRSASGGPLTCP